MSAKSITSNHSSPTGNPEGNLERFKLGNAAVKVDWMNFSLSLKKRSDIHWARKIWHASAVSLMAVIFYFSDYWVSVSLLTFLWITTVPLDFFRLHRPKVNDFLIHLFKPIMRDSEKNTLAGTSYLLSGVLLSSLVFKQEIVFLSLLFLAFADPIASYFGIKYGKDKIFSHKSLQGTFAAFMVCFFISLVFFRNGDLTFFRWIVLSALCGLAGSLAEAIPIGKMDDNLTFPILSGVFLTMIFFLFNLSALI